MIAIALSRMRAADPPAALSVFAAGLVIAMLAWMLAGSAAVVIWRGGLRGAGQALFGFALAAALIAYPGYLGVEAFALPPINDVSTDLASPPTFLISTKARAARVGAEPPPSSEETRAAQRGAYPTSRRSGRDRSDRGLSDRAQRRERPRLAHRRRRAAEPRRRRLGADRGDRPVAVLRILQRHCDPHPTGGRRHRDRRPLGLTGRKARFRRQRTVRPPIPRGRQGGGARALRRPGKALTRLQIGFERLQRRLRNIVLDAFGVAFGGFARHADGGQQIDHQAVALGASVSGHRLPGWGEEHAAVGLRTLQGPGA